MTNFDFLKKDKKFYSFATFVEQTDELKFDCQTITRKTRNTKKSLMQKYIG